LIHAFQHASFVFTAIRPSAEKRIAPARRVVTTRTPPAAQQEIRCRSCRCILDKFPPLYSTSTDTTVPNGSNSSNDDDKNKNRDDDDDDHSRNKVSSSAFDTQSLDFTMGYLNKHHREVLTKFAIAFTPLGVLQAKKNAFSGGSFTIQDATVVDIWYPKGPPQQGDVSCSSSYLELEVTVNIRGAKDPIQTEIQRVSLDAEPNIETRGFVNLPPIAAAPSMMATEDSSTSTNTIVTNSYNPIDDFIRRLNRLCLIVQSPSTTGKLIQLGFQIGGSKRSLLKEDLYLNQVPHNRYVRQYFYDMASQATLNAVIACSNGQISNRMKITSLFPEMNPSMDSYRIGTLLELARSIAITLAEQNLRVRVCVQGSMGVGIFTGTPKQLSGAATLLQRMDWQSGPGEENEGMVGDYINFGGVGKEHVVNAGMNGDDLEKSVFQDDVFLLLCPQSMVGVDASIMGALMEMVGAAGDRPVILINPDLSDKASSQGQQNIRGRKERMEFANSFQTIHHFQNIYVSGTSYFPILGAVFKAGHNDPWVAYQRRDLQNNEGEIYVPILSTEEQPDGEMILNTFE